MFCDNNFISIQKKKSPIQRNILFSNIKQKSKQLKKSPWFSRAYTQHINYFTHTLLIKNLIRSIAFVYLLSEETHYDISQVTIFTF